MRFMVASNLFGDFSCTIRRLHIRYLSNQLDTTYTTAILKRRFDFSVMSYMWCIPNVTRIFC